VCSKCYIKGVVSPSLVVNGTFNASTAIQSLANQTETEIKNLSSNVITAFETYFENIIDDFNVTDFDVDELLFDLRQFPTVNSSFELDFPSIPECTLSLGFDDFELYMDMEIILIGNTSYTLNMYSTETPVGIRLGNDLTLGLVFSVDLVLTADVDLDISTGFHLKLDDGLALEIALFSRNVSDITLLVCSSFPPNSGI